MKRMTMLDMTREGEIIERHPENDSEGVLDGTLLNTLYPNIHVAMVSLPQGSLDIREESTFSGKFDNIEHNGVRYKLAGGSGSVKNRKYYFVDEDHRDMIAERFGRWPEALITYFGILVSSCKAIIQDNIGMLVVQDRTYGTNADRAWFSERVFNQFGLLPRRLYQFRMDFLETMQAKGSAKVMDDEVADFLGAHIILPESCIKPASDAVVSEAGLHFETDVTSGIREVSRLLAFESSYTLIVHAPRESVEQEIIPEARMSIGKVNAAFTARNHPALVELLGKRVPDDVDEQEQEKTPERTVEAVLLADGSGELTRHPYIHQQLNKMLAHWAYKTLTGGGLELPAFALADDGYIFLHQGRLCCGSDWLPLDTAITAVSAPYGLCVRHPVRMREDLLPLLHLHADGVASRLVEREGIDSVEAERIARDQICLQGVYVLNSDTAKRNGGDFDFDYVCVVDGEKYSRFVASRFNLTERPPIQKDKKDKARSPWFNFEDTAIEAGGNKIGLITNLKVSCAAAGREDLEYELVGELQKEIDSLKWGVRANTKRIKDIQKEVPMAPWLPLKFAEKISDFPNNLEVLPTDLIGNMYNELRPDIKEMINEPLPMTFFKGLIKGNNPTRAMFQEARMVNAMYGAAFQPWLAGIQKAKLRVSKADKHYNEVKAETDAELAKAQANSKSSKTKGGQKASDKQSELWERRNLAYEQLKETRTRYQDTVERFRSKTSQLAKIIRDWGNGKTENRRGWAEAVHQSVCRGKGMGSVLFLAFPQEAVDMIAERTGGKRTEVYKPKNAGVVFVEKDRLYSENGGRRKFVLRYESHTQTVHWRNR